MLETLSPELLLSTQQSLDSPLDLCSLIVRSPSSCRIFERYLQLVLSTVLRRAIHTVASPAALAVLQVPDVSPNRATPHIKKVRSFVDRYFGGTVRHDPHNDTGLNQLRRSHVRASYLAADYALRATDIPPSSRPSPGSRAPVLTATFLARTRPATQGVSPVPNLLQSICH